MGKLLISHRSTTYPCYLPVLGRFAGAGRIRLTRGKSKEKVVLDSKFLVHCLMFVIFISDQIKNLIKRIIN